MTTTLDSLRRKLVPKEALPHHALHGGAWDEAKHPRGLGGKFTHSEAREMRREHIQEGTAVTTLAEKYGIDQHTATLVLQHAIMREGRPGPGEKLTLHHAREIRARKQHEGLNNEQLGKEYGVPRQVVWHIVHNTRLPEPKASLKPAQKVSPAPVVSPRERIEKNLTQGQFIGGLALLKGEGNINATYTGNLQHEGDTLPVVVKPASGLSNKNPLQLTHEAGAYIIDQAMGGFVGVPETVVRESPHGTAMVQRFVTGTRQYAKAAGTLSSTERTTLEPQLHKMAVFDEVLANSDRHAGNIMLGGTDTGIRAIPIDHGLSQGIPKYKPISSAVTRDHWRDPLTSEDKATLYHLTDHWGEIQQNLARVGQTKENITNIRRRIDHMLVAGRLGTDLTTW